jgi:hypothetical protein
MTTLITLLFVSTLATQPAVHLESTKNEAISYICYIDNDNVMLSKVEKDKSTLRTTIIDTGISTNCLEKITMAFQNDDLCITATYVNNDPLNAYFDKTSLEFKQITLVDPNLLSEQVLVIR